MLMARMIVPGAAAPGELPGELPLMHSARNLGFIFDEHRTFSDQISALSKSCSSLLTHLPQWDNVSGFDDFGQKQKPWAFIRIH